MNNLIDRNAQGNKPRLCAIYTKFVLEMRVY